ncbi:carbohydrate ABC transporter substrate-binding protein (CUT1 family) [Streptomyces sp. 846.5]|nr:extracellular solute-binding protein [Streptomyces sp. 846.5]TDU02097.1 carbohydrate ABC transporter substrate-binding protein (CUT1 family) [Streptomyces sp. 846.5]
MPPLQPTALFHQLKARLLEDIRNGRYGPDGRLPTEHELCELYGLSRTPVTRALSELAQEGVVLRHRRRGTFVNPQWLAGSGETPRLRVLATGTTGPDQLRRAAGDWARLDLETVELPELHDAFLRAVAEGRGPDLAVLDSVWVPEFARAGFLTPLTDLDPDWIKDEHDTDFLQPFRDAYRFDGALVAVQAPSDVTGLWYRRDSLARLGTEPPRTWRELHALGRRLAEDCTGDAHALALPGGRAAAETTTYALLALLAANGAGAVLRDDAVVLDSPAAVETMRFLRRLVDEGVVSPEVVGHAKDQAVRLLAQGRADLCVGASYQAGDLAEESGLPLARVHERFGFAPMPRGPHGRSSALCGGMAYLVPRQARYPQQAMRLLRAAVEPDALVRTCLLTGQLPPRRSALDAVSAVSPFHAETAPLLAGAVLRPSTPVYALVSTRLQSLAEDVITRRLGPAPAVARAGDTISVITGLPER